MIRQDHFQSYLHPLIQQISDDYPFTFNKNYHSFEIYQGNQVFFLIDEKTEIIVPLKIYKSRYLRSGQFLFKPLKRGKEITREEEEEFIKETLEYLEKNSGIHRIIQPTPLFEFQWTPPTAKNCPFAIYEVNLQLLESDIFSKFQSTTRRQIRRVGESEIKFEFGESHLASFHQVYTETMNRERLHPLSIHYLKSMLSNLGESKLLCGVSYLNGKPITGIFVPFTKYGGFYLYGGSTENIPIQGVNKALFWEAMKRLKKEGANKFILGGARLGDIKGTKFEGIQYFKESFGPNKIPGYLWKKDFNLLAVKIFEGLVQSRNLLVGRKLTSDIIDSYKNK